MVCRAAWLFRLLIRPHAAFVCLDGVDAGDKYRLSAYSNANACIIFIPLIAIWEIDIIIQYSHFFMSPAYWFMLIISGIGGFAIGIVTMLQIQVHAHLSSPFCVVGCELAFIF